MLYKRIIGVIAIENGWAVQSFGYQRSLPLGRPEFLAENLERWGVDEIMFFDFCRSRQKLGPDMQLIERLSVLGLSTPLTYGGGITTAEQAAAVIRGGIERICIDSLLHENPDEVIAIAQLIGAQAVVAAMPLSINDHKLQRYDHRHRTLSRLEPSLLRLFEDGYISEALLIDWQHEGEKAGFNLQLIENFLSWNPHTPLLLYGGISEPSQLSEFLIYPMVSGACIGNFLNYREHALQALKEFLVEMPMPVRPAQYTRKHP